MSPPRYAEAGRLRLYDTRRRGVHTVEPVRPGEFSMYVCGPTVYDRSHVGHGRSYVVYDALKRHVAASGLAVRHVQNFTDIEESIARRAAAEGVAPLALAEARIRDFHEDMGRLGIRPADAYPRVTAHVPEIVRLVEGLVERDAAYTMECEEDECNVYFDVSKVPDYGSLIGSTLEDLAAGGTEETGERRQAADFALWKSRADWGVTWPSPWGRGRPGWHVECAVMSEKLLGVPFDLHGGGLDLVFPHHEAERAIAHAVWGGDYARHYVHNGFVTVGARKMSKSKGNFVYLHDLLARHEPEALRLWFLSAKYRDMLAYDPAALAGAEGRLRALRAGAARARSAPQRPSEAASLAKELRDALDDDLDTARALAALEKAAASGAGVASAFDLAAEVLGVAGARVA